MCGLGRPEDRHRPLVDAAHRLDDLADDRAAPGRDLARLVRQLIGLLGIGGVLLHG